jgi:hypothetical protein
MDLGSLIANAIILSLKTRRKAIVTDCNVVFCKT